MTNPLSPGALDNPSPRRVALFCCDISTQFVRKYRHRCAKFEKLAICDDTCCKFGVCMAGPEGVATQRFSPKDLDTIFDRRLNLSEVDRNKLFCVRINIDMNFCPFLSAQYRL